MLCYGCETLLDVKCDMNVAFLYGKQVHGMGKRSLSNVFDTTNVFLPLVVHL